MITITTPQALILLLTIPVIVYYGWPRNRFRRLRDSISLVIRTVIMLLLVLALAGVQIARSADQLAVVFLVDVSDSMGGGAEERALDYIQQAMDEMRPDDVTGIITFGGDAQVARSMSNTRELAGLRTTPDTGNTNLAAAIRLGLALFPSDAARRMVIISDGQPTLGDARGAAQLAQAAGVEISYVHDEPPQIAEVQLRDVSVPTVLDQNQSFDMTITIASEEDTQATLTILAGGNIISRIEDFHLSAGTNNYTLTGLRSGSNALLDLEVQVEPQGDDRFAQNNVMAAFSRVEGVSRILVVNGSPDNDNEVRFIVPALEESGFQVDVLEPAQIPIGLSGLVEYKSIVLVNVSATKLNTKRMELLREYVANVGGGLVVVGGPQTYAPGGYFQTPLADVLPVDVQIRDQQRLPQLTIAYVIDRSGSMGITASDGVPNIDLAKEAIIRSIDFLQETDRAAVASFDVDAYWIAPFQDVQDRRPLQRLVASLRASGGTSIMAGMQLVSGEIVKEPSDIKHIILLTDGGADPGGLVKMTELLNRDYGVTTSVISINGMPGDFLEDMAKAGKGNFHLVTDAANIPQIFTAETVLASRSYIQEESFNPVLTTIHPIMNGIAAMPNLQGYVATSPRNTAQVILRGPEPFRDPLLAAWQYGLGRSVAFTSDATARWARDWVNWDEYTRFWNQAVRWTITEGASNNLETRVEVEDEQARIIVDARDDDGNFLNGQNLQASIVADNNESSRVQLRQVAPGRYEATFRPQDEGAYFVTVTNQGNQAEAQDLNLLQTTGWVMSYSPEYAVREADDDLLQSLAELTDGQRLNDAPQAVFLHNLTAHNASNPIWPWLLLAAMLLLPLDIAVRRLLVTKSDLQRLRAWAGARLGGTVTEATVERMTSLREARDRARTRTEAATTIRRDPTSSISQLRQRKQEQQSEAAEAQPTPTTPHPLESRPTPTPSTPPKPKSPAINTESPRPEEGNIGARLLKKRRRNEDEE